MENKLRQKNELEVFIGTSRVKANANYIISKHKVLMIKNIYVLP